MKGQGMMQGRHAPPAVAALRAASQRVDCGLPWLCRAGRGSWLSLLAAQLQAMLHAPQCHVCCCTARLLGMPACSILRESAWELELKGDVTRQRRLEAVDKLMSVLTLVVAAVFGVQALGLDVNSGEWLRVVGLLVGPGSAASRLF